MRTASLTLLAAALFVSSASAQVKDDITLQVAVGRSDDSRIHRHHALPSDPDEVLRLHHPQ